MENSAQSIGSVISNDDLKIIHGIGAAVEKRLNDAGIATYEQLGEATPAEVALALKGVVGYTDERIRAQDWIGQARQIADKVHHHQDESSGGISEARQHYAVFTIELLLEQDNRVRRTHILNVQSQQESAWAGWEPARLNEFIARSAALNLEKPAREEAVVTAAQIAAEEPGAPNLDQQPIYADGSILRGSITLIDWSLEEEGRTLKHLTVINRPFDILLDVDLSRIEYSGNEPLRCEVSAYARRSGSDTTAMIGRSEVNIPMSSATEDEVLGRTPRRLRVRGVLQTPGEYRVDVIATLKPLQSGAGLTNQVARLMEGIFIRAYEDS